MVIDLPLLRQSERGTFKRCPTRWFWGYREGLVPTGQDAGARWFGGGIHLCMAEWYIPGIKRGRPLLDTWREFTKDSHLTIAIGEGEERQFVDAVELGVAMLTEYFETYETDPHWDVISPEHRFSVVIPDPRNPTRGIVRSVGTYDLVYRDLNDMKIKMVDHKTCKAIEYRHLALDDQKGNYIVTATHDLRHRGLIGPKETIRGMEYNFLRKAKPDTRPVNAEGLSLNLNGTVSKRQPKPTLYRHWVAMTPYERNQQIKRIGAEAVVMEQFRDGSLPLIKNPTKDCSWDCDFFDLCQVDEAGGDVERLKEAMYAIKDPYMDHREGADNSKTTALADSAMKEKVRHGKGS